MKDGGNLEDEEEATGGCTLTRVIFPDLATTVVRFFLSNDLVCPR